jgi:hypothetical protein
MTLGHEKLDIYPLDETESQSRKMELVRMAAMLSRLGGRGYQL